MFGQFSRPNPSAQCCVGLKAFFTTPQLSIQDKAFNSLALGTSPIVRALVDPEGGMNDIRKLDNISFTDWFKSHGGSQGSIDRMWDPIGVRATLVPQLPSCRTQRETAHVLSVGSIGSLSFR
jgi:uncharacterized protein with NAD-binding domain and iron-sulfur cluster